MNIIEYPEKKSWNSLIERPSLPQQDLSLLIENIFSRVEKEKDQAVLDLTKEFDGTTLSCLRYPLEEVSLQDLALSDSLKEAIQVAKSNIESFHKAQKLPLEKIETAPGVFCWREERPIERVGLYIPGGSAPLFSTVLMLAIPAKAAGCQKIVLCSPPDKNGEIHPAILYAAKLCGIDALYSVGGAQAIAALTLGTETIPKVDKIFGPGNQYVTRAKQYAQQLGTAIDMPAGPSEVLVVAASDADPEFCAMDLLSQAEHGEDSQVVLLSDSRQVLENTIGYIEKFLPELPRSATAKKALTCSRFVLLNSLEECVEFSNRYAPEHLILNTSEAEGLTSRITSAGSVFLGAYSPESAGDYASGTNHTLPTSGFARAYSGISVESFTKYITFQSLTFEGLSGLGPSVMRMAEAEGLEAHKRAVEIRLTPNTSSNGI